MVGDFGGGGGGLNDAGNCSVVKKRERLVENSDATMSFRLTTRLGPPRPSPRISRVTAVTHWSLVVLRLMWPTVISSTVSLLRVILVRGCGTTLSVKMVELFLKAGGLLTYIFDATQGR